MNRRRLIAPRYLSGELLYVIDRDVTLQGDGVAVTVLWRQRKKNGEWGKPQPAAVDPADIELLSDATDREILSTLIGASDPYAGAYTTAYSRASFRLAGPITDRALWLLASSRRLYLREADRSQGEMHPVTADDGPPWTFMLELTDAPDGRRRLSGSLVRGDERMDVREPQLVLASGHLVARGALSRLDSGQRVPLARRAAPRAAAADIPRRRRAAAGRNAGAQPRRSSGSSA